VYLHKIFVCCFNEFSLINLPIKLIPFTTMKKAKIFIPATILIGVATYFLYPSKNNAETFNQELTGITNSINDGKIFDFEPALDTLNGLLRRTSARLSEIEFKTDEESRAEIENLKTVKQRIESQITSIEEEKQQYANLQGGGRTPYEILDSYSTYMNSYPHGVKRHTIETEYQEVVSSFIDGFSEKINVQLTSLQGGNDDIDPIGNMFQLVTYANDQTTRENIEISPDDFDQVYSKFTATKEQINSLVSVANLNIKTSKGNSPQTLKDQFDNYEKGLLDARKRQEETIKGLIDVAIQAQNWVSQAHYELEADIARRRVGWARCNAYELSNKITQAEDYQTTLLSDRVEIVMKYNVSSYCATDVKYRYYQGTFTLVYPVIRGKLGEGYFKSRSIVETT
jgi:hypothetical protein